MLISDAILGFHGVMIPVYASFLLIVGLGFILRRKSRPSIWYQLHWFRRFYSS
jgi:hypothetical protein